MLLIMVILGGSGTIHGVILGAIVFTFVPEYLRITPEFRDVLYGVILLLAIVFVPGGIGGTIEAAAGAPARVGPCGCWKPLS